MSFPVKWSQKFPRNLPIRVKTCNRHKEGWKWPAQKWPTWNLPIDPLPSASALAKAASNLSDMIFWIHCILVSPGTLIRIYNFWKCQMSFGTFDKLLMPHFTIYDCKWQIINGILYTDWLNRQKRFDEQIMAGLTKLLVPNIDCPIMAWEQRWIWVITCPTPRS